MIKLKYHNIRTYSTLCQREFASKAEAIRGEELRLLELAGEITDLEYQVRFVLSKAPRIAITVDFAYNECIRSQPILKQARKQYHQSNESLFGVPVFTREIASNKILSFSPRIYEDVKGVETREFRVKRIWLQEQQGICIKLIQ